MWSDNLGLLYWPSPRRCALWSLEVHNNKHNKDNLEVTEGQLLNKQSASYYVATCNNYLLFTRFAYWWLYLQANFLLCTISHCFSCCGFWLIWTNVMLPIIDFDFYHLYYYHNYKTCCYHSKLYNKDDKNKFQVINLC